MDIGLNESLGLPIFPIRVQYVLPEAVDGGAYNSGMVSKFSSVVHTQDECLER